MQRLPEIRRAPLTLEQRAHRAEVARISDEARSARGRQARESAVQREMATLARLRAEERAELARLQQEQAARAWGEGLLRIESGGHPAGIEVK
jgi:hypothetical protein